MSYLIEKSLLNIQQETLRQPLFVIAHESGNPNNVGLNSLNNEITYMKRNWQSAFVSHWVGGGGRIVQIAQTGLVQWGAGPRANPYAYAQVELARTNSRAIFLKDYAAYVWLLRELTRKAGLPLSLNTGSAATAGAAGIKTHSWVSRYLGGTDHTDPDGYLASWGVSMQQFAADLAAGVGASGGVGGSAGSDVGGKYLLHLVVRGDTLWSLARKHGTTVAQLKKLNNLSSDLIIIGQVLKIKSV